MKAAMTLIGVPVGEPYPPYAGLTKDELSALRDVLRMTVLGPRFAMSAAE
jgi:hypothetical protein